MSKALVKYSGGGHDNAAGVVPAVCSAVIPGVGQLVNGETDKAIGVFAVAVVTGAAFWAGLPLIGGILGLAHIATHVYAVGDAYIQGRKK
jgi:TM2 domain-containing membrane protein YozV